MYLWFVSLPYSLNFTSTIFVYDTCLLFAFDTIEDGNNVFRGVKVEGLYVLTLADLVI